MRNNCHFSPPPPSQLSLFLFFFFLFSSALFYNTANLQSLYLGLNRVNDLAELDKLASIPFLMELSLNSNPISRKQLFRANCVRRLPTLKFIDGREVTYEERVRSVSLFCPILFLPFDRTLTHKSFF